MKKIHMRNSGGNEVSEAVLYVDYCDSTEWLTNIYLLRKIAIKYSGQRIELREKEEEDASVRTRPPSISQEYAQLRCIV